ncbi:MAG: hypothetical protein ACYDHP_14315 [Ferrimicrobium sp.]
MGYTIASTRWTKCLIGCAKILICDWHTTNDAVCAYGAPLVDDPDRFGMVRALGLDETLFYREGQYHSLHWVTRNR